MRASTTSSVLPFVCVLLTLLVGSAGAFPVPDPPTGYELTAAAFYEEGCYEHCLCPVWLIPDFSGGFTLSRLDDEDEWEVHAVQAVAWEMAAEGEIVRRAFGQGSYRVHRDRKLQRLQLDLDLEGVETNPFDSGIVPVEAAWPAIDIVVSQAEFFCFDYVFHVDAEPTGPVETQEGPTWGTLKATYRR